MTDRTTQDLDITGKSKAAEATAHTPGPRDLTPAETRQILCALQVMAQHDAWLAREALSIGGRWRLLAALNAQVSGRRAGRSKRLGELADEIVGLMRAHGLIEETSENRWRPSARGLDWMRLRTPAMQSVASPAGASANRRSGANMGASAVRSAGAEAAKIRPPRKAYERRLVRDEDNGRLREVKVNTRENPLMWLARRKDGQGQPLLEAHHVAAGEKLRADYETACMSPRVTANWNAALTASDRSRLRAGPRDPFPMSERVIAARERVWRALKPLAAEQAEIVLRVCCLSQGLEAAEQALNWPRRSARLILRMALEQLARFYNIPPRDAHKRGDGARPAWRRMLSWHAPDGQPSKLVPEEASE
jgi:hypothetical protein